MQKSKAKRKLIQDNAFLTSVYCHLDSQRKQINFSEAYPVKYKDLQDNPTTANIKRLELPLISNTSNIKRFELPLISNTSRSSKTINNNIKILKSNKNNISDFKLRINQFKISKNSDQTSRYIETMPELEDISLHTMIQNSDFKNNNLVNKQFIITTPRGDIQVRDITREKTIIRPIHKMQEIPINDNFKKPETDRSDHRLNSMKIQLSLEKQVQSYQQYSPTLDQTKRSLVFQTTTKDSTKQNSVQKQQNNDYDNDKNMSSEISLSDEPIESAQSSQFIKEKQTKGKELGHEIGFHQYLKLLKQINEEKNQSEKNFRDICSYIVRENKARDLRYQLLMRQKMFKSLNPFILDQFQNEKLTCQQQFFQHNLQHEKKQITVKKFICGKVEQMIQNKETLPEFVSINVDFLNEMRLLQDLLPNKSQQYSVIKQIIQHKKSTFKMLCHSNKQQIRKRAFEIDYLIEQCLLDEIPVTFTATPQPTHRGGEQNDQLPMANRQQKKSILFNKGQSLRSKKQRYSTMYQMNLFFDNIESKVNKEVIIDMKYVVRSLETAIALLDNQRVHNQFENLKSSHLNMKALQKNIIQRYLQEFFDNKINQLNIDTYELTQSNDDILQNLTKQYNKQKQLQKIESNFGACKSINQLGVDETQNFDIIASKLQQKLWRENLAYKQ